MLWLLCILAYVVVVLACDQWDRRSTRRWVDSRAQRRPAYRAWCEAQHLRAMDRWHADQRANAFWQRHQHVASLIPWALALLTCLAVVLLAARMS